MMQPPHADITLSDGTVITHRREENGSQFACERDRADEGMTTEHWQEYCQVIREERSK